MSFVRGETVRKLRILVDFKEQKEVCLDAEGNGDEDDVGVLFEQKFLNILKRCNPEKYANLELLDEDIRFLFVEEGVNVLNEVLEVCVFEDQIEDISKIGEIPPPVSLRDVKNIATLLQIIVGWGIYPSLMPGIGVSIDWRLENFSL